MNPQFMISLFPFRPSLPFLSSLPLGSYLSKSEGSNRFSTDEVYDDLPSESLAIGPVKTNLSVDFVRAWTNFPLNFAVSLQYRLAFRRRSHSYSWRMPRVRLSAGPHFLWCVNKKPKSL